MKAARLAKALKATPLPSSTPQVSLETKIEVATPQTSPWTKTKLAWKRLKTWQKIAAPVIPVVLGLHSALPHFSVSRETTNELAPYDGEFLFKNDGWIPATKVSTVCNISTNFSGFHIDNLVTENYVAPVVWGWGEFTRGCHITNSNVTPTDKGSLYVGVKYSYPFIPHVFVSRPAHFSFRYDSQSHGFVFVPEL